LNKTQAAVLAALNTGRKITLPDEPIEQKLRTLSALWNCAIDECFADVEKVEIATELLNTLSRIYEPNS
jgi:hypothetical protein